MVYRSSEQIEHDFERHPVSTTIKYLVIGALVVLGLVALVWGITTGWSYWQGKGDLTRQKNSADNFISAQGQFTQEHQDFQNFITVTIPDDRKALNDFTKAHPTIPTDLSGLSLSNQQQTLSDNLNGDIAGCARVAGDYNAQTENYLSKDFRNANLPAHLDAAQCRSAGEASTPPTH